MPLKPLQRKLNIIINQISNNKAVALTGKNT